MGSMRTRARRIRTIVNRVRRSRSRVHNATVTDLRRRKRRTRVRTPTRTHVRTHRRSRARIRTRIRNRRIVRVARSIRWISVISTHNPALTGSPMPSTDDELKKALKAFKKRLKLTQLEEDSRLGHSPLTGSKSKSHTRFLKP